MVGVAALAGASWAWVAPLTRKGHFDHFMFRDVHAFMRDGLGYYDAMVAAFAEAGITSGRVTAFRLPTFFLLMRPAPPGWLWPAFVVLVVVLTTWLLVRLVDEPMVALPAAFYILLVGRFPFGDANVSFLLVEWWVLPAVAATLLLVRRDRDLAAAAVAGLAVLLRETATPLLVGGLVGAVLGGRRRWPWLVAGCVTGGLYLLHLDVAGGYVAAEGNDADLVGTGGWKSALYMASWLVPGTPWVALVIIPAALYRLRGRPEVWPLAALMAVPASGLLVHRPYWGLMYIPILFTLTLDLVVAEVRRRRAVPVPP